MRRTRWRIGLFLVGGSVFDLQEELGSRYILIRWGINYEIWY